MDAALGPPEKMADREEDLTPMLSQYFELCRRYDDSLVLFQVGDFYETFCEAAETTARLCEITLTKREDSTGRYPMAGIPTDNAESYIETLLDAGYRVAVADQIEDPEEASGVVERAVTRIVTPGTLTEDELLRGADNNFVACLARGTASPSRSERAGDARERRDGGGADRAYGLALLDVSTGDFYATSAADADGVADEVGRFAPAEAVVGPAVAPETAEELFAADCMVSPYDEAAFEREAARGKVADYFGSPDALLATDAEVRACGALLSYAEYARGGQEGRLDYLNHVTRYDPREYVLLDAVALRSLELFERRTVHGADDATLAGILDETACALGSRKLTDWLRRPLLDRGAIEARHDAVADLTSRVQARERVHELLADVYDIERLISRVARGRANARDLRSLLDSLAVVPAIREALSGVEADRLRDLREGLDGLPEARELIERAVREDPPAELTEGDLIREGYSEELDGLRETERSGKAWIDDLEASERERTGIESLKVGYNSVHGYYIEVTDPNLDRVPDDYTRRQTLKNSERFVTPELKEREDEIVRAEAAADDLEYELFADVRATVADEAERVQALADVLAELDVLVAFAEVAAKHGYTRPEFGADGIHIEAGRHPVVERTEPSFVPNDTDLAAGEVAVITGPNMSGKSTYMRQVALIQILAQAGSFVPAASAELRLVDRVFTRVGASDDIAGGRSTFMVEMTELAGILRAATEDSLVLLDEVGRGTSTADGLAIARAVTEYVHDEVGATTLFATHHHDLTAVADDRPRVVNLHFDAAREDGEVAFDHDVRRGPAAASYGVDVARMAGVPDDVVERSRKLLDGDEAAAGEDALRAGEAEASTAAGAENGGVVPEDNNSVVSENNTGGQEGGRVRANGHGEGAVDAPDDLVARVEAMDVATMTPLEALNTLADLKRELEE